MPLGNFAFGDYFKRDAILYALGVPDLRAVADLPKDKLWVTVYATDERSLRYLDQGSGCAPSRIGAHR